jgi:hypothetical protein
MLLLERGVIYRSLALRLPSFYRQQQEAKMPGNKGGGHVKNRNKYEALKRKGMSKTRAAKIANSGKEGSRKGGRNSHK